MYFWQRCRHGAVVELFTLITFPLMPAACRNQRAPPRPQAASDVASVCCVLRVELFERESKGERETEKKKKLEKL